MELAARIKEHRARLGLSQDELAQRIYVSRQTISNWETDKTYPDVQSLLLLSSQFDVSIDELIKGDVSAMETNVNRDIKTLNALGFAMLGFTLAALAVVGWMIWSDARGLDWFIPLGVLAFVLWACAMAAAIAADRLKKRNDIVTYQEILAFFDDKPIDRDNPASKRARDRKSAWPYLRTACKFAAGAAVGFVAAYGLCMLLG